MAQWHLQRCTRWSSWSWSVDCAIVASVEKTLPMHSTHSTDLTESSAQFITFQLRSWVILFVLQTSLMILMLRFSFLIFWFYGFQLYVCMKQIIRLVLLLLRFSKSCKRSVSAGFVRKIHEFGFGFSSWWRHYKLMYTPTIERSLPVQTEHNYRPTCHAFDHNAEAIIISDIHLKRLDISASRPRLLDAVAPFNTALFDLDLGNSTTTSSVNWHPMLSAVSSLTHATFLYHMKDHAF